MKLRTKLRSLALAGLVLASAAALPGRAHAAYTLTLRQVGANVVVTGSGTFNLTNLTLNGTSNTSSGYGGYLYAFLTVGVPPYQVASLYTGITGPTSFGFSSSSNLYTSDSGTGGLAGIYGQVNGVVVPNGYTSGSLTSGTATFNNQTFASLGFTPGTYTWTWGTGANADSLTVTGSVPEPSTWALLGAGAGLLGVVTLRRRVRRA